MAGKALQVVSLVDRNKLATNIAQMYEEWVSKSAGKRAEWVELRNYLFATDTTKTTNSKLPWKNKTTLPKLTQIRDNLHANYMSALFPNDKWFKWEGYSLDDSTQTKKRAIEAYMSNKLRQGEFRNIVSQLLYDYIDYGNPIADVEYVRERFKDEDDNEILGYTGPRAVRVSPYDIVFNPLAPSFGKSPKIRRMIKSLGELLIEAEQKPELKYNTEIVAKAKEVRHALSEYSASDVNKATGFQIDGFGDLYTYYQSGYVEILEFEGDIFDEEGNFLQNRLITVIDKSYVVRDIPNPSWTGTSTMVKGGWRPRPDNLWAMGPLDNLVGIQYRIDHLENLKADAMDLAVLPPLGLKGNVEEFEYGPMETIYLGDDGEIIELGKNLAPVITAENQIAQLEQRMEEMAGAPKQAMGIRTPGEKTAFEVSTLENAASRIFQEKITQFEIDVIEPLLNNMLEVARRNLDAEDVVRVMDDDLGVADFIKITKEDITASGKLRPIGARHFAARAQLIQELTNLSNSNLFQLISPHASRKRLASLVEEALGWERFEVFGENVGIMEDIETQKVIQEGQGEVELNGITSVEDPNNV